MIWHSSNSPSHRFRKRMRVRPCSTRRVNKRQSRCGASGTKLKRKSPLAQRRIRRAASAKSDLRPWGAGFERAWTSTNPNRFSSAIQTGFPYCAVDSMTTVSTCSLCSQSAKRINSCRLAPKRSRLPGAVFSSPMTTYNTFLCTSIPATYRYTEFIFLSCGWAKNARSELGTLSRCSSFLPGVECRTSRFRYGVPGQTGYVFPNSRNSPCLR